MSFLNAACAMANPSDIFQNIYWISNLSIYFKKCSQNISNFRIIHINCVVYKVYFVEKGRYQSLFYPVFITLVLRRFYICMRVLER